MRYCEKDGQLVKKDQQGREYTTELGFADFVYSFLQDVGVATTGDIIAHVRDNFNFLEGDIVKTSEKRSTFRYRQIVDNLIKSHSSILNIYSDLTDFHGGICMKGIVIPEDILERAKEESSVAYKRAEELRIKKEALKREEQLKTIMLQKNMNIAQSRGRTLKVQILNAVKQSGNDVGETLEYFTDILQDVAHRHPESLIANDDIFIQAFVAEC